ncbi:MAG: glycine zipper family protein [Synechococcus sp.]
MIKRSPRRVVRNFAIAIPFGLGLACLFVTQASAQSVSYCEQYARDYARRNSQGQALRSTGRGAAGGAIFGAIAGDAGTGAGIGALVGGITGTARQSSDYDYLYRIAYNDCINGRVRY